MTRKTTRALLFASSLAIPFAGAGAAQETARLAGTWDVNIRHFTGRVVNEQWIVAQDGNKVTGKVVVSTRELPLEGTVDGNKITVKVTVRPARSGENDEGSYNLFLGTVDGDSIKGEIRKTNDDGTFSAKRAKS
jgi:hypothetical protein